MSMITRVGAGEHFSAKVVDKFRVGPWTGHPTLGGTTMGGLF